MQTDIGEYIVGAYLAIIADCPFVQYNVRAPGGGLDGLNELDVVGLNVDTGTAYLCEVATHLDGLNYGSGQRGDHRSDRQETRVAARIRH